MFKATAGPTPDFDNHRDLDEAVEARLRPTIRPRSDWAGNRQPIGPLVVEDDVRFLIVHHTASQNDYDPDEVADQILDFYDFHIGPERGWPDLAYNFLIDRFGGIWEARQGSIESAVRGDATGGSQGFALLCSLIGNHVDAPPSAEALASLTTLLAWLAHRYRVDTTPGTTVAFPSRGSNRWPAGTEVTARTISGHRDMSQTTCPGETVYGLLDQALPSDVQLLRQAALGAAVADLGLDPDTFTAPTEAADLAVTDESSPPAAQSLPAIDSEAVPIGAETPTVDEAALGAEPSGSGADSVILGAGATMVVGGIAGLIALRRRRVQG